MRKTSHRYKKKILNQLINFFWTALCFAPILSFWLEKGVDHIYFYLFTGTSFIAGILPSRLLNLLMLSSRMTFYEKAGVKHIRKFVQNGDAVKAMTNSKKTTSIRGKFHPQNYLKTIAMYERYHWTCFTFFLLTGLFCLFVGTYKLALIIALSNILYNLGPILLQQYNKLRISRLCNKP